MAASIHGGEPGGEEEGGEEEEEGGEEAETTVDDDALGDGDGDGDGGDDDESSEFVVHVQNVPSACTMADVSALFAGLGSPFCYKVSSSVVAVQFETASAVQAAVAMTGTILTPPKSGQIEF